MQDTSDDESGVAAIEIAKLWNRVPPGRLTPA